MRNLKKLTLVVSIIAIAALLTLTAIAGATLLSGESAVDLGEVYHGVRVSTSGNISLKFYYDSLGSAQYMVTEITDPSGENSVSTETAVGNVAKSGEKYCITVPLSPSQMNYTVRVYAKSEEGNGRAVTYSVKEYAQDVLADASLSDYHNSMRALLNWGAMAQVVFNDAADALANEGVYSNGTNPIDGLAAIPYTEGSVSESENIKGKKYLVSVKPANTEMSLFVNYTGEGTLRATVSKNGGEEKATEITETAEQGVYAVNISNLGVAVYDAAYTVKITDSNGETFTATKSVLEYLNALAFTSDADLVKYNDIAKSMYQFYVVAMKKTNADSCNHKAVHWISNDESTSFVECSSCFTTFGEGAVGNGVERYLPADMIVKWGSNHGKNTRTLKSDDDGTEYVRIDNFQVTGNWGAWNVFGDSNAPISGRYMIMKFRVGANGLGQSYLKMYTSTQSASLTDEKQGVSIKVAEDNCWHTVVIDLASQVKNSAGDSEIVEEDGTYSVSFLAIRPFSGYQSTGSNEEGWTTLPAADDYMDISYIAYCDSMEDIKGIVDERYFEYAQGSSNSHVYLTEDNTNLSLDYDLSLEEIKFHSTVMGKGIGSAEIIRDENDCDYVRLIPNMTGHGPYMYANYSAAQGNSGKYLVLKYRTNSPATWTELYSSTSVVNPTGNEKFWATSQGDGQWHVFILDMEKGEQDGATDTFVADENGNFAAKHFRMQICYNKASPDYYYDIAIIDWTETLDEAFSKVEGEDIKYGYYNGSKWVDVARITDEYDLEAEEMKTSAETSAKQAGSVTYYEATDSDVAFIRTTANASGTKGSWWVHDYPELNGSSGAYLIFKYRTNAGGGWMHVFTSTQTENTVSGQTNATEATWTTPVSDEKWHVVIVDFTQAGFDSGSGAFAANGKGEFKPKFIGFQFHQYGTVTSSSYTDIAYVRWADSIDGALDKIGEGEDVSCGYYKSGNWIPIELPQ